MKKPSAILLGSKPGSVIALSAMLERGWDVKCVVICPESDYSWIPRPNLEEFAMAHGIPVLKNQDELQRHENVDFVISYMFRVKVNSSTRDIAERAAINFHAGPLPEFGGWAFYSVAILENSREYGCTCHYMDDGFDTGPILKVTRFPIDASLETAYTLERKAQKEMVRLFLDFCRIAESGLSLPIKEQDSERMRYMTKGEFDALKKIPDGADEETVDRYARAFWYPPYECAYVLAAGTKIEVVPRIAKEHMAELLHASDLELLKQCFQNSKINESGLL